MSKAQKGTKRQYFKWTRRQWRAYVEMRKELKAMFRETIKESFRHPEQVIANKPSAIEAIDVPAAVEFYQENTEQDLLKINVPYSNEEQHQIARQEIKVLVDPNALSAISVGTTWREAENEYSVLAFHPQGGILYSNTKSPKENISWIGEKELLEKLNIV